MDALVEKMTKSFNVAFMKHVELIKQMVEKRCDVLEREVFDMKDRYDEVRKENEKLKDRIAESDKKIQSLETKVGENRGSFINLKQSQLKNDLVLINSKNEDPLNVTLGKLNYAKTTGKTKEGKFSYYYSFKDLKDKLNILKQKPTLKEQNVYIFSPLCAEMKKLQQMANQLRDQGRLTKVWFYRDELFGQVVDGDRYCIKLESDIEFLKLRE